MNGFFADYILPWIQPGGNESRVRLHARAAGGSCKGLAARIF
jgi:hypothetical protein